MGKQVENRTGNKIWQRAWHKIWRSHLALALAGLTSCALLKVEPQPAASVTPSVTPSVSPSVSPSAPIASSPAPTESLVPFAVLTAPAFFAPAASPPAREAYACITASYLANLTWQQEQPNLSFGSRQQQLIPAQAARATANPDGSFTYEFANRPDNLLYYARVYPDRTCLLQVVDSASGRVSFEERGQLGK